MQGHVVVVLVCVATAMCISAVAATSRTSACGITMYHSYAHTQSNTTSRMKFVHYYFHITSCVVYVVCLFLRLRFVQLRVLHEVKQAHQPHCTLSQHKHTQMRTLTPSFAHQQAPHHRATHAHRRTHCCRRLHRALFVFRRTTRLCVSQSCNTVHILQTTLHCTSLSHSLSHSQRSRVRHC